MESCVFPGQILQVNRVTDICRVISISNSTTGTYACSHDTCSCLEVFGFTCRISITWLVEMPEARVYVLFKVLSLSLWKNHEVCFFHLLRRPSAFLKSFNNISTFTPIYSLSITEKRMYGRLVDVIIIIITISYSLGRAVWENGWGVQVSAAVVFEQQNLINVAAFSSIFTPHVLHPFKYL